VSQSAHEIDPFAAPPANRSCRVCAILDGIPEGTRRANLVGALAAGIKVWPHKAIVDGLASQGLEVSETTVRRHRTRCV
jgi:hypothetical protein